MKYNVKNKCLAILAVMLLLFPLFVYAQKNISGQFNRAYKIFVPADSTIFVKRFSGSTSVFTYKNMVYLSDGILRFRKSGLVDSSGNIVAEPVYDLIKSSDDSIFIVEINGKQGLLDKYGSQILAPTYETIGSFYDGIATVKNYYRYGYINTSGKEIVPLLYDITHDNHKGSMLVRKNTKTGLLNAEGEILFEPLYSLIRPYGQFIIVMKDKKMALYNKQAQPLLDFDYDGIEETGDDSIVAVHQNKTSWLMNVFTKQVVSKKYPYLYFFSGLDSPGIYRVKQNGKEAMVNRKDELLTGRYYDNISLFYDGLAPVTAGNKQGYINKSGKLVIPLMYDRVWACYDGLCFVMYQGKKGFINADNKWLFQLIDGTETDFFYNGFAKLYQHKKIGFINKKGEVIVTPVYEWVENYKNRCALVYVNNDIFYINEQGQRIR